MIAVAVSALTACAAEVPPSPPLEARVSAHSPGAATVGGQVIVTAMRTTPLGGGDAVSLIGRAVSPDGSLSPAAPIGPAEAFWYSIAGDERSAVLAWWAGAAPRVRLLDPDGRERATFTLAGEARTPPVTAVHGRIAFVAWVRGEGDIAVARVDRDAKAIIDPGSNVELGGPDARFWRLAMASGPDGALLVAASSDSWITGDMPVDLAATRLGAEEGIRDVGGIWLEERVGIWSLAPSPARGQFLVHLVTVRDGAESYYDYEDPRMLLLAADGSVSSRPSPLPHSFAALASNGEHFLLAGRFEDGVRIAAVDAESAAPVATYPLLDRVPLDPLAAAARQGGGFVVTWAEGYSRVLASRVGATGEPLDPVPILVAGAP